MKYSIFKMAGFLFCGTVVGQSTIGITRKPDTSYTTFSAYQSTKKTNPEIKIVYQRKYDSIIEEENIPYASIGTRKLLMEAFYPKGKTNGKRIAVLIIHGGGWRTGNRSQHYPLAEKLASMGYACFTPEYRLSTEALFPAAVYDLKESIRWIKRNAGKYNIDTAKIVVSGFSAGGELAAFLGVTGDMPLFEGVNTSNAISTRVNAIVDMDGILSFTHPESGEGDDSKRTSAATYWFGYSKKEQPKVWEAASSLSYAGEHTPPTLFINSGVDRMHAGRTDYIKILDQFQIYSEVHTFVGAPHSFPLFDPWFEPMVSYIDVFLKKVFKR